MTVPAAEVRVICVPDEYCPGALLNTGAASWDAIAAWKLLPWAAWKPGRRVIEPPERNVAADPLGMV
jgi:hypothetical protein